MCTQKLDEVNKNKNKKPNTLRHNTLLRVTESMRQSLAAVRPKIGGARALRLLVARPVSRSYRPPQDQTQSGPKPTTFPIKREYGASPATPKRKSRATAPGILPEAISIMTRNLAHAHELWGPRPPGWGTAAPSPTPPLQDACSSIKQPGVTNNEFPSLDFPKSPRESVEAP